MSKYLASVFCNKMFVIFDKCWGSEREREREQNCMSNFVCRSLTFEMPGGEGEGTHTHTFQITYCLVKQKFFITFHKLRLFIRDHNFVLCIFFLIRNIFRTAPPCSTIVPSSFLASLIFFSIFLLSHAPFYMLARKLKLCYYFA